MNEVETFWLHVGLIIGLSAAFVLVVAMYAIRALWFS